MNTFSLSIVFWSQVSLSLSLSLEVISFHLQFWNNKRKLLLSWFSTSKTISLCNTCEKFCISCLIYVKFKILFLFLILFYGKCWSLHRRILFFSTGYSLSTLKTIFHRKTIFEIIVNVALNLIRYFSMMKILEFVK